MGSTTSGPPRAVLHDSVGGASEERARTDTRKTYSRLIGALFLAGFITYGVGFALVSSVVDAPDFLAEVSARQTTLVLGAFLMLLNTGVDLGKAVLFFPVLERHGRRTALTYLSAMVFEVVLLAFGALSLLSLVPLAHQLEAGEVTADLARSLGSLAVESNAMAYQVAQAGLAFGAVFLCVLLCRARLLPRWLAGWGLVGYVVHFLGAGAEISPASTSWSTTSAATGAPGTSPPKASSTRSP